MKALFYSLLFFFLYVSPNVFSQNLPDSVTISGKVTDYEGNPLDSVSVGWHRTDFSGIKEVLTDKNGCYKASLKKGKYYALSALNMKEYIVTGSSLPEEDMRLEFWAWNFIADKDTTLNIQYHRMEVYGINVFHVQGATPGYTVYFRPMSLTRYLKYKKAKDKSYNHLAPDPDKINIKVTINGTETPVLMKQKVKEYFDEKEYGDAYLLFVAPPKEASSTPYDVFKLTVTDLENGDKGEGMFYLEKENEFIN